MLDIIQIHDNDNVVVTLKDLSAGQTFTVDEDVIELKHDVPRGHKVAIKNIDINEHVVKYGYPIGHAIKDITVGEHIHTHNTKQT